MTEEERLLLKTLKANTKRLFDEFQKLEETKNALEGKLALCHKEIKQLREENESLSQKTERLEMANRILTGKDEDQLAGKKINEIVREIDKCIALLNK